MTDWYIFEPTDDALHVWRHVGTVAAHGREHARNRFYRGRTEPVPCVVVSSAQWQPAEWIPPLRRPASVNPLPMPSVHDTPEEPAAEDRPVLPLGVTPA